MVGQEPTDAPGVLRQLVFGTTHWSIVLAAANTDTPEAAAAVERRCRTYRYPLHGCIRRQGHAPEAAEDLTQEFFANLLARDYLSAVRQERGRFRWFLLCAVKRFLINERKRERAAKRGGTATHLSFDGQTAEERCRMEAADRHSPDQLFDRSIEAVLADVEGALIKDVSMVSAPFGAIHPNRSVEPVTSE